MVWSLLNLPCEKNLILTKIDNLLLNQEYNKTIQLFRLGLAIEVEVHSGCSTLQAPTDQAQS